MKQRKSISCECVFSNQFGLISGEAHSKPYALPVPSALFLLRCVPALCHFAPDMDTILTSQTNVFTESGQAQTVQLTEIQFRALLQALAKQAGSMVALGEKLGISDAYLGQVVSGRKRPSQGLVEKFRGRIVRAIEIPVDVLSHE